jgi:hypothetical protein
MCGVKRHVVEKVMHDAGLPGERQRFHCRTARCTQIAGHQQRCVEIGQGDSQ